MSVLNNSKFGISLKKFPNLKKNCLDFNYPKGKGQNSPGEKLWAVRRGWGKALLWTVPGNIKEPGQIRYSSTSYLLYVMWYMDETWKGLRKGKCPWSFSSPAVLLIWWTLCLWDYCGKKRIRTGHHTNIILTQYTSVQAWELFLSQALTCTCSSQSLPHTIEQLLSGQIFVLTITSML